MNTRDSTSEVVNLSGLLQRLFERFDDGSPPETKLTIADLLETIGRRAYGPLLLFIGLFSISPASFVTGMTWLSATIIILIALQMLVGRRTPWLPRNILRIRLTRKLLFSGLNAMKPWARRIDRFLKPRLTFLTGWPFVPLVALVCIVSALISYPAGFIPGAPFVPGMVIVLVGLGMTARDGLMILLGTALVAGSGWFLFRQLGWA
ncbi:MAG: exopolysaccharide biosynthesis protein [Alphaproteobacteria bacterium]